MGKKNDDKPNRKPKDKSEKGKTERYTAANPDANAAFMAANPGYQGTPSSAELKAFERRQGMSEDEWNQHEYNRLSKKVGRIQGENPGVAPSNAPDPQNRTMGNELYDAMYGLGQLQAANPDMTLTGDKNLAWIENNPTFYRGTPQDNGAAALGVYNSAPSGYAPTTPRTTFQANPYQTQAPAAPSIPAPKMTPPQMNLQGGGAPDPRDQGKWGGGATPPIFNGPNANRRPRLPYKPFHPPQY